MRYDGHRNIEYTRMTIGTNNIKSQYLDDFGLCVVTTAGGIMTGYRAESSFCTQGGGGTDSRSCFVDGAKGGDASVN